MTDRGATGVGNEYYGGSTGYEAWRDPGYTETKSFFRTSEFWAFVLVAAAVLLAAYMSGEDSLSRDDGWRYAVFVTVGYLISRGLAKAGSREPTEHDHR